MRVAVYTSLTFSYLGRGRVLAETLKAHNPDWDLIAVMPDMPPSLMEFSEALEPFDRIIWYDQLGIPDVFAWIYKHDIVEVCTGVKGFALKKLLEEGYDLVFYLDPDIAVFGSLQPLADIHAGGASVTLTPHQLTREQSHFGIIDNELGSLKHGVYNLGYVGCSNDENGRDFADWWAARLERFCYDDIPNGMFTDQRWCDLAPALFEGVEVVRDPAYNTASWNMAGRRLRFDDTGALKVNDSTLAFYHFTKMGPTGRRMTARYGWHSPAVFELWRWYEMRHDEIAPKNVPKGYWFFGNYEDATPIDKAHRIIYRTRMDLQRAFPDPFRSSSGSFQEWLQGNS